MIKTEMTIEGMACGMCEAHISDALRKNFPARHIRTSFRKRRSVFISDDMPDEDELRKVISDLGYTVVSVHCSQISGK